MLRAFCPSCESEIEIDDDVIECTSCGLVAKILSRNPLELEVVDEASANTPLASVGSAGSEIVSPSDTRMENLTSKDHEMRAALKPYLEQGEQLKNWAYGVEQSFLLNLLIVFLSMIPAALLSWGLVGSTPILGSLVGFLIWIAMMAPVTLLVRKDYVVGLSDRRFMILRVKTPILKVNFSKKVAFRSYNLDSLPPVKTSIGRRETEIEILDSREPFNAEFFRFGVSDNLSRSAKIAASLSEKKALDAPKSV